MTMELTSTPQQTTRGEPQTNTTNARTFFGSYYPGISYVHDCDSVASVDVVPENIPLCESLTVVQFWNA